MCCSIVMINFIGCRNYKKENREALEYLNNKYGKEFELEKGRFESVYGDEFYQSPQKETKAWPKDSSNDVFNIEFDSEGNFYDDYQSITMKPNIEEYLQNLAKEYWSDANISVEIVNGVIREKYDEDSCEEYLADKNVSIYYYIYLHYEKSFDVEKETRKVYEICKRMRENNFHGITLVGYINEKSFDNYSEKESGDFWAKCKKEGKIARSYRQPFYLFNSEKDNLLTIDNIRKELEKDKLVEKGETDE